MTRGQRGKVRLIVSILIAMLYYKTGLTILGIIGFGGIGYYMAESLFGDAMERLQKERQ